MPALRFASLRGKGFRSTIEFQQTKRRVLLAPMDTITLEDKNAVIYGGGGSLGRAIAKAMARAGANVFLAGRNLSPVKKVADEIIASGGHAEKEYYRGHD